MKKGTTLKRDGSTSNNAKPQTKCNFTKLKLLHQKESSESRIEADITKTYSSNHSYTMPVLPPTVHIDKQNSAKNPTQNKLR